MDHAMPHRVQALILLLQPGKNVLESRRVIREIDMFLNQDMAIAVLDLKMAARQSDPFAAPRQRQRLLFTHGEHRDLQARGSTVDRKNAMVVCVCHLTDNRSSKAVSIARVSAANPRPTSAPRWM